MALNILNEFVKIVRNKPIYYLHLQCNICNSLFEKRKTDIEWYKKRGRKSGSFCSNKCAIKFLHFKRIGTTPWNKGKSGIFSEEARGSMSRKRRLEKNPNWKGGITRTGEKSAYIGIKSPTHPFRSKQGYVLQHRLVMEEKLGRYLLKQEVIHHINGNKTDNRIENLQLFSNNAKHKRVESMGTKNPNYKHGRYIKK